MYYRIHCMKDLSLKPIRIIATIAPLGCIGETVTISWPYRFEDIASFQISI